MEEFVQALTTIDDRDKAGSLAKSIVDQRLAACVQIVGPINSVYWWNGALEESQEWQLHIKTTAAKFSALEVHIKANHSYETPEIIVTPIIAGSPDYLRWISEETRQTDASS